ncbi:auxin-induced protein 15A-like [Impatiens glandulifera]|uniref:auxin-induced protein 15A-like n=1 Tax=Impatiens glandulifera TaxID=253017 RepID=UPI001FB09637|nr:auxin-induced protein 15A-like [Impatiens glandulifera]
MSTWNKISFIVQLRRMVMLWRRTAARRRCLPPDIPVGHVPVRVGCTCRRFVVPARYLNHESFRKLLHKAEEEYGFANPGPLAIPCDEIVFEEILFRVARSELVTDRKQLRSLATLSELITQ